MSVPPACVERTGTTSHLILRTVAKAEASANNTDAQRKRIAGPDWSSVRRLSADPSGRGV